MSYGRTFLVLLAVAAIILAVPAFARISDSSDGATAYGSSSGTDNNNNGSGSGADESLWGRNATGNISYGTSGGGTDSNAAVDTRTNTTGTNRTMSTVRNANEIVTTDAGTAQGSLDPQSTANDGTPVLFIVLQQDGTIRAATAAEMQTMNSRFNTGTGRLPGTGSGQTSGTTPSGTATGGGTNTTVITTGGGTDSNDNNDTDNDTNNDTSSI